MIVFVDSSGTTAVKTPLAATEQEQTPAQEQIWYREQDTGSAISSGDNGSAEVTSTVCGSAEDKRIFYLITDWRTNGAAVRSVCPDRNDIGFTRTEQCGQAYLYVRRELKGEF
ncbi:hypothetical protein F2P79_010073 [Pimephales promelas]|nr:hypothetical protein F2P79_010073 [Pimephales promelas]